MRIACEIEKLTTLKKGSKMVIIMDDQATDELTKHYANFKARPLIMELNVDTSKVRQLMNQITEEQRRKVYVILKDMSMFTGHSEDETKLLMKSNFLEAYEKYQPFSLANCTKQLATDFITYLIMWCFKNGVPLNEHPRDIIDDDEKYFWICIKLKKCAICGNPAEIHHWDAIGMGRDRRDYDDSDHRKIALCREHHTEVETIGRDTFAEKYHVTGIMF